MPTKPLGLRERNRIRTRDEILVAMSVLLGERAYETITIDDVAQRAGVSRGTIYTYFPDGRDQLVRDAYQRTADIVSADGAIQRDQQGSTTDRIIGLATALVGVAVTPEGRFYGRMGPDILGALAGRTGSASRLFRSMLAEDLRQAAASGELPADAPIDELAVLISGAMREIGVAAAEEPERAPQLLRALRISCDALLAPGGAR